MLGDPKRLPFELFADLVASARDCLVLYINAPRGHLISLVLTLEKAGSGRTLPLPTAELETV